MIRYWKIASFLNRQISILAQHIINTLIVEMYALLVPTTSLYFEFKIKYRKSFSFHQLFTHTKCNVEIEVLVQLMYC